MRNEAELKEKGLHSWNFRIIKWGAGEKAVYRDDATGEVTTTDKLKSPVFSVHEFFYDKDGKPAAMTEGSVLYDFFDEVKDIKDALKRMTEDCNKEPMLAKDLNEFFSNENK